MVLNIQELLARLNATRPEHHGDYLRFAFPAMGTQNALLFRAPASAAAGFWGGVVRWLAAFEARVSRYIPTSRVSLLNAAAGDGTWHELDPELQELFALSDWFHWKTAGVFDPTVGAVARLWSAAAERAPDDAELAAARELVGWHKVERTPGKARLPRAGMQLDFGGIGKEYAVDRVFALAQQHGIRDLLIDFGRDLRVSGQPPEGGDWRLGLEHPGQPDTCWSGVALQQAALCCSGDYRRFTEVDGHRRSHLVDPRNGQPAASGVHAVWAIAPTCIEAGILTTTACILGMQAGGKLFEQTPGAAGCIWSDQGLYQTQRFQKYEIKNILRSA